MTEASNLSPLNVLMERMWVAASSFIAAHPKKEWMPSFVAETASGERHIYKAPWGNDFEKQLTLATLRERFRETSVKRYVVASEAWFAQYTPENDEKTDDFVMPSKRDDRVEVLWIIGADPEAGEVFSRFAKIVHKGGRRRLEPVENMSHAWSVGGDFTELLGPCAAAYSPMTKKRRAAEWTDPRSPIWSGLKLSARFRVTEAMKHILAHGSLRRSDIMRIGEVSMPQASIDIREIIDRTDALTYDVRGKRYVLKAAP